MYSEVSAPQNKLSKDFIKARIISETIGNIIGFIVLGLLFFLDYKFTWPEWIGWILFLIAGISIIGVVWSLFIEPNLIYKQWRYGVNEDFLQLKFGVWKEKHELIPMTKIQSVATKQGPIQRKYRLYSITITTMGSTHSIPALSGEVAVELRKQIAQFAKIKEVE